MTTGTPPTIPTCCDTLLLGVCGSVSAALMPRVALLLRRTVAKRVLVVISQAATQFVTPAAMSLFSGGTAFVDRGADADWVAGVPHLDITREADTFLLMPATANILAKSAHGIADDLVSTTILSYSKPIIFVPSMNGSMWRNAATVRNVSNLRERGHIIVDPGVGYEVGDLSETCGVMPEPEVVLAWLRDSLSRRAEC